MLTLNTGKAWEQNRYDLFGGQFVSKVLKLCRLIDLAFPLLKEIKSQVWIDALEYSL